MTHGVVSLRIYSVVGGKNYSIYLSSWPNLLNFLLNILYSIEHLKIKKKKDKHTNIKKLDFSIALSIFKVPIWRDNQMKFCSQSMSISTRSWNLPELIQHLIFQKWQLRDLTWCVEKENFSVEPNSQNEYKCCYMCEIPSIIIQFILCYCMNSKTLDEHASYILTDRLWN